MWPAASSADVLVAPSGPTFASVGEETVVFNGYVYFAADNGAVGNELWRTNGTTTELVKDFNTGGANDDGNPGGFRVAGNRLFFNVGNNDASPSEGTSVVYYIDSSAPTTPVKTFIPFIPDPVVANGNLIGAVNGKVLLQQHDAGGNHGLYALGGSGSTFADIDPGTDNVSSEPAATMGGFAYLTIGPVGANGGTELYRTDGSSDPVRVKDINTTSAATGSSPFDFVATGNRVYFEANNGVNGIELWVTDGSDAGTQMVKDHTPGAASTSITAESVANGNTLFYVPNDPATSFEPWKTDGTPAGTALVKDVTPGTTGSGTTVLAPFGSSGFVATLKGDVYTSDGTAAGTVMVADPDADGMGARLLGAANSRYYFRGGYSPFGGALWRTDGTVAGTGALTVGEFTLGATGSFDAGLLTALGNKVIFFGYYPGGAGQRRMYVLDTSQPDPVRQVTTAPSVSGTPAVGQQLTGNPGAWTLGPFNEYAFQWLRNGVPIPGTNARAAAYKPVAADNGTQLSFRVTATGIGMPNEVVAVSSPVTVRGATPPPGGTTLRALTVRKKPKLTGTARVGKRLKVTLPTFAQSGVALTFRWFANGKRIAKQTKSSLTLKKAHKGKRITVKVTATKAGYKTLELKAGPTQKVKRKL